MYESQVKPCCVPACVICPIWVHMLCAHDKWFPHVGTLCVPLYFISPMCGHTSCVAIWTHFVHCCGSHIVMTNDSHMLVNHKYGHTSFTVRVAHIVIMWHMSAHFVMQLCMSLYQYYLWVHIHHCMNHKYGHTLFTVMVAHIVIMWLTLCGNVFC